MSRYDLVSIIVPALNESASLEELYERTRDSLAGVQPFEFIVIDDGSTDDSLDKLKALRARHPNLCILSHYRNHGKSLALMQGFAAARGQVAVIMDADLQDQPEMIPRFLEKIDEGFDLVNGWREDRRDRLSKVAVSAVFNLLTSRIFNCPIHDINCGFKAMRRRLYTRLELRGDLHRLIPAMAAGRGFKITEIPVTHSPRRFGRSRYRLLRHRGMLDIVALAAGNATQWRPFHVFCEAAIICWLLAIVALAVWVGLTLRVPEGSLGHLLAKPLVGLFGVGAAVLGMVLPLFGFHLEITGCRLQDADWRNGLLKERINAKVGGYGSCTPSKGFPQERGRRALLEPDSEPVSLVEGATARGFDRSGHAPGSTQAAGSRLRRGQ